MKQGWQRADEIAPERLWVGERLMDRVRLGRSVLTERRDGKACSMTFNAAPAVCCLRLVAAVQ